MNLHVPQEGSKEWDDQRYVEKLEVVEELLEEEMLVSLSNHWLMVMWRSFGNGSSSGCHGGLWWLIMDEEDDEVVDFSKYVRVFCVRIAEARLCVDGQFAASPM
ncbi:hypothetical protein Tco_0904228 [Tanacetum coccineum]